MIGIGMKGLDADVGLSFSCFRDWRSVGWRKRRRLTRKRRSHRATNLLNETRHVLLSISESADRSGAGRTSDRAGVAQE